VEVAVVPPVVEDLGELEEEAALVDHGELTTVEAPALVEVTLVDHGEITTMAEEAHGILTMVEPVLGEAHGIPIMVEPVQEEILALEDQLQVALEAPVHGAITMVEALVEAHGILTMVEPVLEEALGIPIMVEPVLEEILALEDQLQVVLEAPVHGSIITVGHQGQTLGMEEALGAQTMAIHGEIQIMQETVEQCLGEVEVIQQVLTPTLGPVQTILVHHHGAVGVVGIPGTVTPGMVC